MTTQKYSSHTTKQTVPKEKRVTTLMASNKLASYQASGITYSKKNTNKQLNPTTASLSAPKHIAALSSSAT